MGLIIYVSLILLTPKILSLLFDPQDDAFLSWAHSYAAFHNRSKCWVCGALPSSSVEGFPWWTSPLQGKDFLQVCEYLRQQSHAMPLLHLMTFTNPKMDWCTLLASKLMLLIADGSYLLTIKSYLLIRAGLAATLLGSRWVPGMVAPWK